MLVWGTFDGEGINIHLVVVTAVCLAGYVGLMDLRAGLMLASIAAIGFGGLAMDYNPKTRWSYVADLGAVMLPLTAMTYGDPVATTAAFVLGGALWTLAFVRVFPARYRLKLIERVVAG